MKWLRLCLFPAVLSSAAGPVSFDLTEETVVIYNSEFPESRELAEYYASRRGIAKDRVVGLKCPSPDSLSRREFESKVRQPLFDLFVKRGWWRVESGGRGVSHCAIRVLALMRGMPFQVRREEKDKEDEASVDSELTMLGLPGQSLAGAQRNPYFEQPVRFQMFQGAPGLLIVGRLDAPKAATVRRMIDDALAAEQNGLHGRAVIDLALKTGQYAQGERWLQESAITFRKAGLPVYLDVDEPVLRAGWPLPDTAFYFGWYATNMEGALTSPAFQFKPGAIACHVHSYSASALRSETANWAGPLLERGAAAVLGNVFEPYLALTTHLDQFNARLLEGCTLAEAAWSATPVVSWMNIVLGDPLYRPFAREPGSSLGETGDRDYGLYRGLATRQTSADSKDLKVALVKMAEQRGNARLLELTGLLSATEGLTGQAGGLMDHATAIYGLPADRLRVILYAAEFARREGRLNAVKAALNQVLTDPAYRDEPALEAARLLLDEVR